MKQYLESAIFVGQEDDKGPKRSKRRHELVVLVSLCLAALLIHFSFGAEQGAEVVEAATLPPTLAPALIALAASQEVEVSIEQEELPVPKPTASSAMRETHKTQDTVMFPDVPIYVSTPIAHTNPNTVNDQPLRTTTTKVIANKAVSSGVLASNVESTTVNPELLKNPLFLLLFSLGGVAGFYYYIARKIYERDGYKCVVCSTSENLQASHLDHSKRDPNDPTKKNPNYNKVENGETLCKLHHLTRGHIDRVGENGMTIALNNSSASFIYHTLPEQQRKLAEPIYEAYMQKYRITALPSQKKEKNGKKKVKTNGVTPRKSKSKNTSTTVSL